MPARIAICLFEENIDSFNLPLIFGGHPLTKIPMIKSDPDAQVYLKVSNTGHPDWVQIVDSFANLHGKETFTASSGAILLFKIKKRIIACCFGTSVTNINKDNIITDFGLAVAFHRIPRTKYKKIETYTLTENPITNNRSATVASSQNTFNMDAYLETVTELGGKFFMNSKSVTIKGKEFFSTPAPLILSEIKDLCGKLIEEYEVSIEDPNFKKMTAVSRVKTKKLIEYLNQQLCTQIKNKSQDIYLADYQQHENLNAYSFTPKGNKLLDINIQDVYDDFKRGQPITVEFLRIKKITIFNSDDQVIDQWQLYKCLFFQITINIGAYILYKGNWYEIQKRFLDDLKNFIDTHEISSASLGLPAWDGKVSEGVYNQAVGSAKIQCWDKILYRNPDFSYGIEFCDLLSSNSVMHVKKLVSSSLNSHLLMQTAVSAQLLQSDPKLKTWIKYQSKKQPGKNIFLKTSNEFKVPPISYVIVLMTGSSVKKLANSLPFFSLITFNMVIRKISQDFNVKLCQV